MTHIQSVPPKTRRDPNLDLIRCVAILLVVTVHFFLNTGYYGREPSGWAMGVMVGIRTGSLICVPLFALLTGYLCGKKEVSLGYFLGLIPLLTTYVLACIPALLFTSAVTGERYSLLYSLSLILKIDRGAILYAWYLEMYLGLFLLTPFLNLIWKGLRSHGEKCLLLGALLVMTCLPNAVNVFDFRTPGFWQDPTAYVAYQELLPDWWTELWPVTYFFLGAYLREYDLKLSKKLTAALLVLCLAVFTLYNLWRGQGRYLFSPFGDNYGGLENTILSVLAFHLLRHLDLSRLGNRRRWLLERVSRLSFGIYLCSYISDCMIYVPFNDLGLPVHWQLAALPLVVAATFTLATLFSQLVDWVQNGIFRGLRWLWERLGVRMAV